MWEMFTALKYGAAEKSTPAEICRKLKTDHTLPSYMVRAGILKRDGKQWIWMKGEPTMKMVLDCYEIRAEMIAARGTRKPQEAQKPEPQEKPQPQQLDLFARVEALEKFQDSIESRQDSQEARLESLEASLGEFQILVAEFKGSLQGLDQKLDQLLERMAV